MCLVAAASSGSVKITSHVFTALPETVLRWCLELEKETVRHFATSSPVTIRCKLWIDGTYLVHYLIEPVVKGHYEGTFKAVPFYQPKLKETLCATWNSPLSRCAGTLAHLLFQASPESVLFCTS